MTAPVEPGKRPEDVDTGFWLWAVALPLLTIGRIVDVVSGGAGRVPAAAVGLSVLFVVAVAAVTAVLLVLLRDGYRWSRTVLTGGGVATVVVMATNLFGAERPDGVAVAYAICVILGSVAVAGGVYLLHRKDADAFFTR